MKNYYDFRKDVHNKLTRIVEEKISRLVLPKNSFGYTGTKASYTVSPFGVREYLITVILQDKDTYDQFIDEFYELDDESLFSTTNWKRDGIWGFYGVDLYVNRDRLEEAQSVIKDLFEKIK